MSIYNIHPPNCTSIALHASPAQKFCDLNLSHNFTVISGYICRYIHLYVYCIFKFRRVGDRKQYIYIYTEHGLLPTNADGKQNGKGK